MEDRKKSLIRGIVRAEGYKRGLAESPDKHYWESHYDNYIRWSRRNIVNLHTEARRKKLKLFVGAWVLALVIGLFVFGWIGFIGEGDRIALSPGEVVEFTDGFEDFIFTESGDYSWNVRNPFGDLRSLKISGFIEGEIGSKVGFYLTNEDEEVLIFEKILNKDDVFLSPEDFFKEEVDEEKPVDEIIVSEEKPEEEIVEIPAEDVFIPEENPVEEKPVEKEIVEFSFLDACDSCELPEGFGGSEYGLRVVVDGLVDEVIIYDVTYGISNDDVPPVDEFPPAEAGGPLGPGSDFKIQRGTSIITAGSLTNIITEGVDFTKCNGPCFIKLVSNRNSGMGRTSGGGLQNFNDFEAYISGVSGLNNFGGTVIFERNGVSNNNRVTWEIWEYTGPISGNNEMAVLDRGVCTFNPSSLTCDGVVIPSGANDNNDVVVFVTGHGNADNNRKEGQYCWITSEWVAGSNLPRFTRGEAGGFSPNAACDVSYAVVEFKGTNWNVQRVEHIFSGSVVQPHTILNVVDISKAFFHTQQRNNPGNNFDGLCQAGSEVELVGPTTLEYRLPLDTTNWGPDMKAVTWVVWNTQAAGQVLKVNHYNSAKLAGGPAENNWQEIINPLTYSISESAIGGFSGQSANCGIGFPKGYINARLTNPTTVDLWQSDPGQNQEYTFQVIEFPTASISNNAPTLSITSINQGNPVDLFPGGTAPIEIQFNVQDLDGLVDLDQDTLLITFGFPSGGPFTETETAVITDCPTLTDIGNTRFYTCLNDMLYYDHFGTWDAFVSIDDFSGDNGQDTDQFEVLKLLDISLTPESIDFPDVLPGDVIEALIPTVVTNNGNVEVPLDTDLEIAGFPLVGQFIGDSISPTQFKAAGSLAAGRVCDELISIPEGVPIVIPTVFLQRGPVGNTENLDFCLDTPFGISNDHYNTAFGEQPWEISLVSFASGLAIAGRRRKKKKPISSKKTEILENLLEDLLSILKERKTLVTESIQIPLSIFKSKLSPAEAVCKFLKENIGKKFNEIANLINRNQRTIWINYNNSIKKQKNKLVVPDDDITVPVSIFENREMSILESIVSYLSQEDYSNKEISKILGKSPNNVWTLIKRVKEKLGNEKDF